MEEGNSDGFISTVARPTDVTHVIRFSCHIRVWLFCSSVFREPKVLAVQGTGALGCDISVYFFYLVCVCVLTVRTYLLQHSCTTLLLDNSKRCFAATASRWWESLWLGYCNRPVCLLLKSHNDSGWGVPTAWMLPWREFVTVATS